MFGSFFTTSCWLNSWQLRSRITGSILGFLLCHLLVGFFLVLHSWSPSWFLKEGFGARYSFLHFFAFGVALRSVLHYWSQGNFFLHHLFILISISRGTNVLVFFNVNELWHLFAVFIICTIFFIMVKFGSFEIAISLASGNLSFSLFFGLIFLGNSLKFR